MARKKYNAAERSELLRQLAKRTESMAGFAKKHGVSAATLYKWQGMQEESGGGFVEIKGPAAQPAGRHLLLRAGEVHLYFEGLPEAGWLASLVQKLQG
jgi:transposase-like protein